MRKLTASQRNKQLKAIAALRDDQIDTSDIPELTDEHLQRAARGQMYRPSKKRGPLVSSLARLCCD
jgi:hypothetical protein